MPAAEVEITDDLVRALLAEQLPDLAATRGDAARQSAGTTRSSASATICVVRLPRRQLGANLVEHEHRWLPELARTLPIPIPAPVRTGVPGCGFPWRWSVCPFFDGDVAADVGLTAPTRDAQRLGEFVAALHRPAPPGRAGTTSSGGASRSPSSSPASKPTSRNSAPPSRLSGPGQTPGGQSRTPCATRLAELAEVAEWDGPALWVHGDLHSANVVVKDGSISAVIDFGDLTSGDPAVDLAVAWMLFDEADRAVFRAAAGSSRSVDDATWQRGQLWALHFAVLYLLHSADAPRFQRMGTHLLAAVL